MEATAHELAAQGATRALNGLSREYLTTGRTGGKTMEASMFSRISAALMSSSRDDRDDDNCPDISCEAW